MFIFAEFAINVVPIVTDADEFGVSKAASSFCWLVVLLVMENFCLLL